MKAWILASVVKKACEDCLKVIDNIRKDKSEKIINYRMSTKHWFWNHDTWLPERRTRTREEAEKYYDDHFSDSLCLAQTLHYRQYDYAEKLLGLASSVPAGQMVMLTDEDYEWIGSFIPKEQ